MNAVPAILQRIILILENYDIELTFKQGNHFVIAMSGLNIDDKLQLDAHVCLIEKNIVMLDERL